METVLSDYVKENLRTIAINIRRIRGDMSQGEFGKKTGLSRTTVSRMESGENFNIASLFQVAEAFGLDPFAFCMTDEQKAALKGQAELYKQAWEKEIEARIEERVVRRLAGHVGSAPEKHKKKGH